MRVDRRGEGAREHTGSSLETGNQNIEDRSIRPSTNESGDYGVQRLIESDLIGIVLADLERIFEANDAFLRMVGYSRDDLQRGLLRWPAMTPLTPYIPAKSSSPSASRIPGISCLRTQVSSAGS